MKWTDGITFAKFKGLKKTDTVKKVFRIWLSLGQYAIFQGLRSL